MRDRPRTLGAGVLAAAVAIVPVGATSAATTPSNTGGGGGAPTGPISVSLGVHTFNTLTPADGVTVRVSAAGVGWSHDSAYMTGPVSFTFDPDGGAWLLDAMNKRLLGWPPGAPTRPTGNIPLPVPGVDAAWGPGGDLYVTQPGTPRQPSLMVLYRVARDGRLRWWAPLASPTFNDQLRVLPDGLLYEVEAGTGAWIPVVTAAGAPLSVSAQRRLTQRSRPLPNGRHLTATAASYPAHEVTVAVVDAAGHASRTWRITSTTDMAIAPGTWPDLSAGDPVVLLDVFDWHRSPASNQMEQVALRLTDSGAARPIHLDNAHWGDEPVTEYRIGPGGDLYQLRSRPTTGVTIARYRLLPSSSAAGPSPSTRATATTPTQAGTATTPTQAGTATTRAQAGTATAAPAPAPAATGSTTPTSSSPARAWVTGGVAVLLLLGLLLGAAARMRHRRRVP